MAQFTESRPARPLWLVAASDAAHFGPLCDDLQLAGFDVTSTSCAGESRARWEDAPPPLVLVDLQGDVPAALGLCKSLRADATWSRTAIVMLHDGTDPEALAAARDAGATEFLERPFHAALLEHRLNSAVRGVMDLLAALPEYGIEAPHAPWPSFEGILGEAMAGAHNTDNCVAVIAVTTPVDGDERAALPLFTGLTEALRDFERTGPISHPKGDLSISRDEQGIHFVAMPAMGRLQDAARLGQRIQEFLSELEVVANAAGGAEVSVGIANFPGDGATPTELCEAARDAVQVAREESGDTLKFRNAATDKWVSERLILERSLDQALENDELVLHYQPKVELGTDRLIGFEALVRWQHPELGMVPPMQFIPLAEETGLIVPIGEWVLETACRQNKAWQDAGYDPVRVAVNISPIQFRQEGLPELVNDTLERLQLSAQYVELEVTESMLMHDVRTALETLRSFKEAGVYLSIDDFGTGCSSLSYLKTFPVDALKIDRSFIRDVTANTEDAAVTTSIILMGRSLNMHVIAEGVETENQRAFLKILQCDEIQGYLISPPVPADRAVAFLTKQT